MKKKKPAEKPVEQEPMLCELCESPLHTTASHEARLEVLEAQREEEYNRAFTPPERQHSTPPPAKKSVSKSKEKGDEKESPEDKERRRRAVELGVGMLEQNVRDSIRLLIKDPDLYQRAGELVRVVRITQAQEDASKDSKDKPTVYAGTPTLANCPPAHMLVRMSAHVPCKRWSEKKKELVLCDPPMKLVMGVLENREYPGIRHLRGIAESPFMRPDGTICQKAGYDPATGYLYAPLVKYPLIPEKPTQRDAERAYKKLFHIYKGLEFVSDTARGVPIAGILTIFAQAAIRGCTPIFMTEANTPGTGKTNVTDTVGIIAMGRPMPRRSFPGPGEELRKVLDAYARDGTRFFLLDNIRQDFGGEALEAAVTTEGEYDLRVLGETRNMRVEWKAIVFGSGNNIGFESADIIPRLLLGRMETAAEDPRARDPSTFLIKQELRSYVKEHRIELAVAALTILRAYTAAGRPDQDVRPWGSFEAWNALIPPAIRFAGGPDVNECRISGERARAADTDSQHLTTILERLPALYARMPSKPTHVATGSIIDALYEPTHWGDDSSYDSLRGALEGLTSKKRTGQVRPNAQGLGMAFRRMRGRVLGGKRLVDRYDEHQKCQMWGVETV